MEHVKEYELAKVLVKKEGNFLKIQKMKKVE